MFPGSWKFRKDTQFSKVGYKTNPPQEDIKNTQKTKPMFPRKSVLHTQSLSVKNKVGIILEPVTSLNKKKLHSSKLFGKKVFPGHRPARKDQVPGHASLSQQQQLDGALLYVMFKGREEGVSCFERIYTGYRQLGESVGGTSPRVGAQPGRRNTASECSWASPRSPGIRGCGHLWWPLELIPSSNRQWGM